MTERPITDVVAALIWQEGKFLICQRPAHKARGLLWEFVGGKVEPGETKELIYILGQRDDVQASAILTVFSIASGTFLKYSIISSGDFTYSSTAEI